MAKRVKRRETPEQRLDRLEREHNRALDKIANARYGPIAKSEASYVSSERSRARRQASGRDRTGRLAGFTGRKSVMRKTPRDERRARVEKDVEEFIRRNPSHPVAKEWRKRTDEIDRIRAAVNDDDFLAPSSGRRVRVRSYEQDRPPVTDVKAHGGRGSHGSDTQPKVT